MQLRDPCGQGLDPAGNFHDHLAHEGVLVRNPQEECQHAWELFIVRFRWHGARQPLSWRSFRGSAHLLPVAAGVYLVSAAVVHPVGVTITDEVQYFNEAVAIAGGRSLSERASYVLSTGVSFEGPRYPAGWPALLAPFTRLPWPAVFIVGALLHLLGFWLFSVVLGRRGIDRRWALLYLAQPTLITFSRTLMAEPLAAVQIVVVLLAAELEAPLALGLVAGLAPLVKLSQLLAVGPFVGLWLLRRLKRGRTRDALLGALGVVPGLALYLGFNHRVYGHWLAMEGAPTYVSAGEATLWLGVGLLQLSFAWPLLPFGALRARAEELAGSIATVLYLALYGYHYRGPNVLATLVVGARLHTAAIVLLLPGYAALLDGSMRWRRGMLAGLSACALTFPFLIFRGVSRRRDQIEALRAEALAALRPGCVVGYSPFAAKLLLQLPGGLELRGADQSASLELRIGAGGCVDLIDPLSEPSTYQGAPTSEAFPALLPLAKEESPGVKTVRVLHLGEAASTR